MRQPGERQGLTPESLAAGVVAEGRERAAQQHLDSDDAIEPAVVCLPHFAHASGADSFEQPIATRAVCVHGWRDCESPISDSRSFLRSGISDERSEIPWTFIVTPSIELNAIGEGEVLRVGDEASNQASSSR